jgi:hypothetical protein
VLGGWFWVLVVCCEVVKVRVDEVAFEVRWAEVAASARGWGGHVVFIHASEANLDITGLASGDVLTAIVRPELSEGLGLLFFGVGIFRGVRVLAGGLGDKA